MTDPPGGRLARILNTRPLQGQHAEYDHILTGPDGLYVTAKELRRFLYDAGRLRSAPMRTEWRLEFDAPADRPDATEPWTGDADESVVTMLAAGPDPEHTAFFDDEQAARTAAAAVTAKGALRVRLSSSRVRTVADEWRQEPTETDPGRSTRPCRTR